MQLRSCFQGGKAKGFLNSLGSFVFPETTPFTLSDQKQNKNQNQEQQITPAA